MRDPKPLLTRLSRCNRGATAVEYGFVLALIVLVLIGALTEMAGGTTDMWNNVSNKVQNPR
ncbi:Flp family type IVb pilin [Sphingomonas sp.]|jgi:pilus assembly protein Flp/PilA|uniref:Flp family type IVb pilin n=1 Tax=Sphingomonas sp. TaxID=28214 RepID=UPI003BAB5DE4